MRHVQAVIHANEAKIYKIWEFLMRTYDLISKFTVNTAVIKINYVSGKFVIFNKKEDLRD